ncbi:CmpA/NrtA family ABC transporter substrate-binding protein [Solimonas sp. SE-A11]|uniref:CmpA/NrtA family ABC transporter substrate-binding protein n=1 Tax=Solimonas sp. SE-A11 TaxID=3054954 RepID=UPI00259D00CD|nr:CmpA/NrtA family ABC transporter substrate-binding protein [Solimonas sp. SE-A11]MDM4769587.1 CmpA/NrtA family ABC transporter substrate-binding protein [Solimonas sp. SE-A11]
MINNLEKSRLRIGIVPLADAAPIVVAQAAGHFARHGLDVSITVESAWAGIRDKLAAGLLDAAHMLAPMPLAATLGIDGIGVPMLTAMSLSLNGNAITVSNALYRRMRLAEEGPRAAGAALRRVIEVDRAVRAPPLVFAHVFPHSAHHYELRYWLAGCGIDPDRDLRLVVVPPPQMVQLLQEGRIDGFCVGAPWGGVAERANLGRSIVTKHQIWNNSPEKVLGVTRDWAERHPLTHLALVAALIEASRSLEAAPGRLAAAEMLKAGDYVRGASMLELEEALAVRDARHPRGPGLVFHSGAANFPWHSHAHWFVAQMQRWGHVPSHVDAALVAAQTYRPDLYRIAAERVGQPCPRVDTKPEGVHAGAWAIGSNNGPLLMGPDLLFDGSSFDTQRSAAPAASVGSHG